MDRAEVADRLDEIGTLLELKGENPFKVRAYHNAARLLRGLDRDLNEMVESGELSKLRGIGSALSEKITTLVKTGKLPYLQELRSEIPAGLLEWIRIPSLGPRKARAIHEALGITTLGELEYACKENRLRDLEGFGETSQRKILEGIDRLRRHAGRFLQPVVRAEAERLLEILRAVPGVKRAEVAGSVRRRLETSKDIDIVVSAKNSEAVMEAFVTAPGVAEVTGRGPTKSSVRLDAGPGADLRVVADASFPFALMYFTGSKAHNIALRGRAQKMGYKLNEYALAPVKGGRHVRCADEAAVYRKLGLAWIPPELREELGEIEAAEKNRLPRLIEPGDIRGILHCHSTWSDGSASIEEMARAAKRIGMEYLGIADHSRSAAYAGGLTIEQVREQHAEIARLNGKFGDSFRVLKGIEVDILPNGSLDYPDEVMATFDFVVASVHSRFGLTAKEQTRRILKAMESPYVDILGHVTGRLLLARDPYPLELEKILDAAAKRGVAVEVNAHPQRLDLDWRNLHYALARGMKTAIDPDSHDTAGLADIEYGVAVARKGWCTAEDALNTWPLDRLLDHLAARRPGAGRKAKRRRAR